MSSEKERPQSAEHKTGLITKRYVDLVDDKENLDPTFDRHMLADLAYNRPQRLQAYLKKNNLTYLHLLIIEKENEDTIEVTMTDGTGAKITQLITREEEAELLPKALFVQRLTFEDYSIGKPFSMTSTSATKVP